MSSNEPLTQNPDDVKTDATPETSSTTEVVEKAPAQKTGAESTGKSGLFDQAEKVVSMDELEEEKEYSSEEFENFMKLYENTISDFVEGEVVSGRIVSIGDKEISVDIGFKSEGIIPIEEFADTSELEVGRDIEVFLDTVEDKDGQLVLSKKKADFTRVWERIVASAEKGEIIRGRCMRRIKGGIVVDLGGVDAFLPGSQIDVRPIRDFDAYIGQELDFRVVKVNELRKNIVVSHRVLIEEELKEQREKILANLEKGQVLEGTVKNITDFGVFIDLGGVDGLLHINDLSWGRVGHPSEIVDLDQKIEVMVLDFNEEKDRISLGLKQLQPEPWKEVEKKYPAGSVVPGKVVSISDYGAFVELEKGVEGLVHISEMSWTQHIRHPSKVLSVGEKIEAKVLDLDVENRKISLSLRALQPDPWEQIGEKYPIGSTQTGVVRNLTNFGAFVELEEGIDGLVHISDLSWTKKIRHPGEVLKKGDEVEVVVLNLDKENRRISLGYKQTKENPWETFAEKYAVGQITTGKIVRMIDKGVITELPEDVDGFVPITHLAKPNLSKPSEGYAVGDVLQLAVIDFNAENKKIILSEKVAKKAAEEVAAAEAPESTEEPAGEAVAEVAESATEESVAAETSEEAAADDAVAQAEEGAEGVEAEAATAESGESAAEAPAESGTAPEDAAEAQAGEAEAQEPAEAEAPEEAAAAAESEAEAAADFDEEKEKK